MTAILGALGAGLAAGLGIALPIGPVGTYLVGLGASAPRRVAASAAAGVATTDGGYALLAVTAGAALEPVLRPVSNWLRWGSVAVLCLLAVATLAGSGAGLAPLRDRPRLASTPLRAYLLLIGVTAVNPATLAYFTSLVLGRQAVGSAGVADRVAFVLGALLASLGWQLLLTRGGAGLAQLAGGRHGRRSIAVASSLVMLALAATVAF